MKKTSLLNRPIPLIGIIAMPSNPQTTPNTPHKSLTPRDYDTFFKFLRENNYNSFVSSLDAALGENGEQ